MDRRSFLLAGLAATAAPAYAQAPAAPAPAAAAPRPFAAAATFSAQHGGAALVVMRNGIRLLEDYPDGAGAAARRSIGAATTSFIPALVGAMVSDRLLTLDEPASQTFGEWGEHPQKNAITLRMLLDGTSGLAARRQVSALEARALEPTATPGSRFIEDSASLVLFLEAARIKLAQAGRTSDPALYVSERVLAPIGCAPVEWRRAESRETMLDGAALPARAWVQWGELMRRVGVWRARELIAGAALRDACRGSWVQPRYGFGLWLAWPAPPQAPVYAGSDLWSARQAPPLDLVMAASAEGDRLFVLPTQRLVVARQAATSPRWSDAEFIRLLLTEA